MKDIIVEGFTVRIERGEEGGFVATVPELPGIVCQVEKEEQVKGEMRKLIGIHLKELVSDMKPSGIRTKPSSDLGGDGGKPREKRIKK